MLALLDQLAIERLPEHLSEELRTRHAQAEEEQAQREERHARYEQLLAEVPAMSAAQRAAALEEAENELGISAWSQAYHRLKQTIEAAETPTAPAEQDPPDHDATPATGDDVVA